MTKVLLQSRVAITNLRADTIYYNMYAFTNMIKKAGFIGANFGVDDKIIWVPPKRYCRCRCGEIAK